MAPKVERLVNLTIALLEARRPQSLEDLRRRTGFYDQSDRESARRMFERDKDELRRLGVPVQTTLDPLTGEAGYVIDRADYELPDVDLTREEMAALAVALRMTGHADERLALSKLAARAPDPIGPTTSATGARVALETQAVDGVADAVVGRQPIRFTYRTGSGSNATAPSTRTASCSAGGPGTWWAGTTTETPCAPSDSIVSAVASCPSGRQGPTTCPRTSTWRPRRPAPPARPSTCCWR